MTHYLRLTAGYKEWLEILNYHKDSVKQLPNNIHHFLQHLKREKIYSVQDISEEHITSYIEELKTKLHPTNKTLLKSSTINGYIRNLKLFAKYLEETGQHSFTVYAPYEPKQTTEKETLSQQEVQQLYNATTEDVTGLRDRAILSIYYGCGLRSNEGTELHVNDVLMDKNLLYIRQGKQYKERYVPFVAAQKKDIENYLQYGRPQLLRETDTPYFLLNNRGKKMKYGFLSDALKRMIAQTGNEELKNKSAGMHHLRHSIATHLMQSGMQIENISTFLGHRHLSSTQIYTHIVKNLHEREQ